MAIAARLTQHALKAYRAVRRVEGLTQAKLDLLHETNTLYKLFEHDSKHPYHALAKSGHNSVAALESLISGVLEWTVDSGTIAEELDKLKAAQIADGLEAGSDLDALRQLQPVAMSEADAAAKLLVAFHAVAHVSSACQDSVLNGELAAMFGKRNIGRHKETPELKIAPECRAAVRAVTGLAKELGDCGNGASTIRRELEKRQVLRVLSGQGKDNAIERLTKR